MGLILVGRFINADPLYTEEIDIKSKSSQDLNLFAYAKNNPINAIDPEGLEVLFISFGFLGFTGDKSGESNPSGGSKDIGVAFDTTTMKFSMFTSKGSVSDAGGGFVGAGVSIGIVGGNIKDFHGPAVETNANVGVGLASAGITKIETSTGKTGGFVDILGPGIGAGASVRTTDTQPLEPETQHVDPGAQQANEAPDQPQKNNENSN